MNINDELITIDDLAKVSLRVGTILTAEKLPKSDKLLKLSVDFGEIESVEVMTLMDIPDPPMGSAVISKRRTVLSGIGKTFVPEVLIGKQFLFVTNLPPRKMMGIESEAMILATGEPDSLVLFSPTGPVLAGVKAG